MKKSRFQFTNPRVANIRFAINENFERKNFDGISINSEISSADIEENKEALVRLRLRIGEKTKNMPFMCEIEMVAKFKVEEEMEREQFQRLLNVNAPAMLTSYARPIIAFMTMQSGLPVFHLPFIDFTESEA